MISVKILFGKFQFKRQSDLSDLVFYCTQPEDSLSLEQYDQSCSSSSHTFENPQLRKVKLKTTPVENTQCRKTV